MVLPALKIPQYLLKISRSVNTSKVKHIFNTKSTVLSFCSKFSTECAVTGSCGNLRAVFICVIRLEFSIDSKPPDEFKLLAFV